jgi:MinD-like ATPase involved in chromosome partitioning or flagellar assembly
MANAKIVSIHSFRGGTGKSNATANIAVNVARLGKRVAIVDTDIYSPGIHVLFGFDENNIDKCLNHYLWGQCKISDAAYDVSHILPEERKNLIYLVPASIKTGDIAQILKEGFDFNVLCDGFYDLIEALELDYLFIDTHPGLNEETLLSTSISDILIIVLRPDKQDFQGTAVTVEVARRLEVPKMMLLINKALSNTDQVQLKKDVEKIYQVPLAGILPQSEEMMQLQSSGIFSLQMPDHPLSKVFQNIAQMIIK